MLASLPELPCVQLVRQLELNVPVDDPLEPVRAEQPHVPPVRVLHGHPGLQALLVAGQEEGGRAAAVEVEVADDQGGGVADVDGAGDAVLRLQEGSDVVQWRRRIGAAAAGFVEVDAAEGHLVFWAPYQQAGHVGYLREALTVLTSCLFFPDLQDNSLAVCAGLLN